MNIESFLKQNGFVETEVKEEIESNKDCTMRYYVKGSFCIYSEKYTKERKMWYIFKDWNNKTLKGKCISLDTTKEVIMQFVDLLNTDTELYTEFENSLGTLGYSCAEDVNQVDNNEIYIVRYYSKNGICLYHEKYIGDNTESWCIYKDWNVSKQTGHCLYLDITESDVKDFIDSGFIVKKVNHAIEDIKVKPYDKNITEYEYSIFTISHIKAFETGMETFTSIQQALASLNSKVNLLKNLIGDKEQYKLYYSRCAAKIIDLNTNKVLITVMVKDTTDTDFVKFNKCGYLFDTYVIKDNEFSVKLKHKDADNDTEYTVGPWQFVKRFK